MSTLGSSARVFLRLLRYLHAYRFRLIAACLCSVAVAGLTALYAWLVRPFLDGIFIEKSQFLLVALPVVLLGVAFLKGLFAYGQSYLMTYISYWLVGDIREQLFVQLTRLPVTFHDSNSSGRLVSRVMNDVGIMGNALPGILKNVVQQVFTFLALVVVLFVQDWKLATILLVVSPVSLYAASRIGDRLRQLAIRGQELAGDMAAILKDAFSGIRILKVYGREDFEARKFQSSNHSFIQTSIKSGQLAALTSPLMEIFGISIVSAIIVYGGNQVIHGTMTPGEFSSFVTAMVMAYAPIRRIGGTQNIVQSCIAAAERVFSVLDLEHEWVRDSGRTVLQPISRSLEFRHVSFRYEGSHEEALADIDLTVKVGEVVALVGKTGSGKTTLVSLLPRFYEPSTGVILMDGFDIRSVTLQSLRRQIAIVSQDLVLFDDTVKRNIAYGHDAANDEDISEAAKAAYAMEFIDRLPQGLDTMIGENGVKLSGGQRQRLAIARAIVRNAPLLILDEATSSLDSESEMIVQQALANLMKGRTTLVIAHRLSTIQHADRIVVLDQGHMIACGPHKQLFDTCETYRRLYLTQFQESKPLPGVPLQ